MTPLHNLKSVKTRNSCARTPVFLACLFLLQAQHVHSQRLTELTRLKQWPGVSQLIAYKEKIWFVNSQPFKDTNAADIYSYTPQTNSIQYERSLFSQDAGNPVVHQGMLYWPFEDPRRSAGAGEYAVTDGNTWMWRVMQDGRAMHVHAMGVCDDQLVAVTGSWTGEFLKRQEDSSWQSEFTYPSGTASFSRLVNVAQYNNQCILGASANGKKEAKLFSINDGGVQSLPDWPSSDRVDNLTVHNSDLFAFADTENQRRLLHFDGETTREIKLPHSHRPRSLHSNGETLWLATQILEGGSNQGQLWQYDNKGNFKSLVELRQTPVSITSLAGQLYIGTYSSKGGALWIYSANDADVQTATDVEKAENPQHLPEHAHTIEATLDKRHRAIAPNTALTEKLYEQLLQIVSQPEQIGEYARTLRNDLARHPDLYKPEFGLAITRLLLHPLPEASITMFTRQTIPYKDLVHWYLLNTLAINGNGQVDPTAINPERSNISNPSTGAGSGKIFEPSIAAISAVGWLGQNDQKTLAALMQRLNNNSDPQWVKSDVIGALTAITGQRFAYDIEKWNRWWSLEQ